IRAGRMDPEGEGTTNGGRICGIIGTFLNLVIPVCCGIPVTNIWLLSYYAAAQRGFRENLVAMPALIIDCPSCGRKLQVPDELLGKAVKCPTCEHTFQSTAV